MWGDAYVEYILIRERIADAQQRATMNHLLRAAAPVRARRGVRELVSQLLRHLRGERRRALAHRSG
jgi:hypothetical protein